MQPAVRQFDMPDLDIQSELLIFESIFTTFKPGIVFNGSWGSIKNLLEPKTEPKTGNLACPNLRNDL
jgi:hypothetical protein